MGLLNGKAGVKDLYNRLRVMAKQRVEMIEAFKKTFVVIQEKVNVQARVIDAILKEHPEILKQLQVQSEEAGTDEDSSGDGKPRILSLPSAGADSGDKDDGAGEEG